MNISFKYLGYILQFKSEFRRYAKRELGLTDPFREYYMNMPCTYREERNGFTMEYDDNEMEEYEQATLPERQQWIKLRDEYIAQKFLEKFSYQDLINSGYNQYIPNAAPCHGSNRQCHLDCPFINNCLYKGGLNE